MRHDFQRNETENEISLSHSHSQAFAVHENHRRHCLVFEQPSLTSDRQKLSASAWKVFYFRKFKKNEQKSFPRSVACGKLKEEFSVQKKSEKEKFFQRKVEMMKMRKLNSVISLAKMRRNVKFFLVFCISWMFVLFYFLQGSANKVNFHDLNFRLSIFSSS